MTGVAPRKKRRIPHSFFIRAAYSFLVIAFVVGVGTIGMHGIENMSYLDAFYFTSMIATGQGPNFTPVTAVGKIFAALLAFVSVGTVIAALIFLFGPFFGSVLRLGVERIEEEAENEREKVEKRG
ncbi:MAG: hypothetical protein LYZ66_05095 [Nitrososphaerales archaeon]|nr:hypothetical protein [Nitrososphaerales archaeon]